CRSGRARTVLAGGVDALCRLTYHGFRLLQLCDPAGARPLDCCRKGMSVAEGAALLLLQAAAGPPPGALAELRGGGLSCDAYHPTKPQPEGEGAKEAMARALADGDAGPQAVGYVNLHGTGTPDNDAAEAKAVRALFAPLPPVSSTKGLTGHTLAAAGALEAVISVLALQDGLLWPNVGLGEPDPALALEPVLTPVRSARPLDLVLSNSFGFGGNNAALLLGRPELPPPRTAQRQSPGELRVLRSACFTGAGDLASTLAALRAGQSCSGLVPAEALQQRLPPALTRRLKRLPRLVLALAEEVRRTEQPRSVFCGTAWGALSETYDFLDKLHASQDQFSSPTDFVGSVHNAPAAQVAMRFAARGANVTATSRATSFEQAVLLASLLAGADDEPLLLLAADEAHGVLGPLFDPRAAAAGPPADGGGALLCAGPGSPAGVRLRPAWLGPGAGEVELAPLLDALGGAQSIARRFAALLVGFPEDQRDVAEAQLAALLATSGFGGAVVRYRPLLGRYGTAAAAAAAAAVSWVEQGALPAATAGGTGEIALQGRGLLLLTLGEQLAAIEVGG
ncbi:MAG: 3-oxoacyl-ACP synthase, partial [Deltaproteobacteria bacterium]|nr:3-oxoacyl-ACP synthase [Deltaproteobacteria bacterium]